MKTEVIISRFTVNVTFSKNYLVVGCLNYSMEGLDFSDVHTDDIFVIKLFDNFRCLKSIWKVNLNSRLHFLIAIIDKACLSFNVFNLKFVEQFTI